MSSKNSHKSVAYFVTIQVDRLKVEGF